MKRLLVCLLLVGVVGCGNNEPEVSPDAPLSDTQTQPSTVDKPIVNSIGMKLTLIPTGEFQMGSPGSDSEASDNEKPQHLVKITQPFYLGVYEVTQEQYERVMGQNPSDGHIAAKYPVESVSWNDAVEFCRRLSELPEEKAAGHVYRLPTEAEWEYACRAGTTTVYSFGDSKSQLGEYAWFNRNGGKNPVGQKKPNPWGLYDMHGNVMEWCQDRYGPYGSESVSDPKGPAQSDYDHSTRGGHSGVGPKYVRSAVRNYSYLPDDRYFVAPNSYFGFRVAKTYSAAP